MKRSQFLLIALLTCATSPAQPQALSAQATGHASRQITFDVVVTDKSGNSVSGLEQQDFIILDNKQRQPISIFRAVGEKVKADDPLRVVFVIDEINIPFAYMASARQQLERYLRQNNGQLPVPMSLVIVNEKSTQVQGTPTRNGNLLADSVHAISAGAPRELEGNQLANVMWRIQISLRAMEKLVAYEATQPGRKLLIWLGPGWPLIMPSADKLTTKEQETDFQTVVKLSTKLRDARVTVYSIDPAGMDDASNLRNFYYQNFLDGVPSANKFQTDNLLLAVLAVQSGGLVLNRSNDVASLVGKCIADASAYYSLTFDSSPAGHADEYHDLQVKIEKPGLVARTRTGYYAQP